jgi:hypothetical protein
MLDAARALFDANTVHVVELKLNENQFVSHCIHLIDVIIYYINLIYRLICINVLVCILIVCTYFSFLMYEVQEFYYMCMGNLVQGTCKLLYSQ